MPLYEYQCSKCGTTFEVMQKFSDPPLAEHPGCGGAVEKLLSAPAFHLKGSGWYATDYAKSSAKTEAPADKKPDAESGAKTETKPSTDTKSETKAPAAATKTD
jgi:putative FmdB family regulatory protein